MYDLIDEEGIEAISNFDGHPGNLALPRKQEFIGTLNRYRGLKVKRNKSTLHLIVNQALQCAFNSLRKVYSNIIIIISSSYSSIDVLGSMLKLLT